MMPSSRRAAIMVACTALLALTACDGCRGDEPAQPIPPPSRERAAVPPPPVDPVRVREVATVELADGLDALVAAPDGRVAVFDASGTLTILTPPGAPGESATTLARPVGFRVRDAVWLGETSLLVATLDDSSLRRIPVEAAVSEPTLTGSGAGDAAVTASDASLAPGGAVLDLLAVDAGAAALALVDTAASADPLRSDVGAEVVRIELGRSGVLREGARVGVGASPLGLFADAGAGLVAVPAFRGSQVTLVDAATGAVLLARETGFRPAALVWTGADRFVVAPANLAQLEEHGIEGAQQRTVPVPAALGAMTAGPAGLYAFSPQAGVFYRLDLMTLAPVNELEPGHFVQALAVLDRVVVAADADTVGRLVLLDAIDLSRLAEWQVAGGATRLEVVGHRVLVAANGQRRVTLLEVVDER